MASVLVVGAGPTGLVLAAELCRRGVPCELIDERSGPRHWDRATVVHPGSLEVFEAMGIADRFMAAGTPQRGARLHADGEVLGEYEITDSGSTYPYNLGLSEDTQVFVDRRHGERRAAPRPTSPEALKNERRQSSIDASLRKHGFAVVEFPAT